MSYYLANVGIVVPCGTLRTHSRPHIV